MSTFVFHRTHFRSMNDKWTPRDIIIIITPNKFFRQWSSWPLTFSEMQKTHSVLSYFLNTWICILPHCNELIQLRWKRPWPGEGNREEAQSKERDWISNRIWPVNLPWSSTINVLIRPHSQQFPQQLLALKQESGPAIKEQQVFAGMRQKALIPSLKETTGAEKSTKNELGLLCR